MPNHSNSKQRKKTQLEIELALNWSILKCTKEPKVKNATQHKVIRCLP